MTFPSWRMDFPSGQMNFPSGRMCFDSLQICVDITPEYTCFIPNAFSPNHDGINDEFYCKATNVLTFEMTIYDRWGAKVFFTDDLLHYWMGDLNENKVVQQEDTYVYVIHIKDTNKEKHDYIGKVYLSEINFIF